MVQQQQPPPPQPFGDTTLTKVFVGGLAWETQKDSLRDHFARFGDILEAVIISDRASGRSKGYGFVTFKDAEGAKKACEDPTPVINGRRANCNLASLGARRPRSSSPATAAPPSLPPPPGARSFVAGPWYYAAGTAPTAYQPQQQHYHGSMVPVYSATASYGYSPSYITSYGYNPKVGHGGGPYVQGQFAQLPHPSHGGMYAPVYHQLYHFQHHQPQSVGLPAHVFSTTTAAAIATVPAIISKPPAIPPTTAGAQRESRF